MSFNVEIGLLSKLLETKDLNTIKEQNIKPSYFTGEHKQIFNFIQTSYLKNGEVPTVRAIQQYFPDYKFETFEDHVGTDEGLLYWCNEVRRKAKHNRLADMIEEVAKKIDSFETEDAFSEIKKEVVYIESELSETKTIDITKNTEDRIKAYEKRKENKGIVGLPTGIQHLDNILRGLEKQTVTTFIGKTSVGKSWIEVLIGAYCMLNNVRVLQIVTEMSDTIMQDRYEAILYGMMYGDFNYSHFKSGKLDKKTEELYYKFLLEDLPHLESLLLKSSTGVISISSEIDVFKPDIVLIDGMYLLEDDQGAKDDWLRIAHIMRDLKKLAKNKNIPIVVNTQADIKSKDTPGLADVRYAKAINEDSDNVIAIYRDDIMKNDNELGLKVQKQREGVLGNVVINWDFTRMNFTGIYGENTEEKVSSADENKNILGVD